MPNLVLPIAVVFLHNLFTAVWVGGLIVLGAVILPVTSKTLGRGAKTKELIDKIQDRLSTLVYISMVGLLGTGMLLAKRAPQFEGLFSQLQPKRRKFGVALLYVNIAVGALVLLLSGISVVLSSLVK
jgi:uncharacterized membrane protein